MSTTTIPDVSTSNDAQYSSVLFKKKLAMLDNPTSDTISNSTSASVWKTVLFFYNWLTVCFFVVNQTI